MEKNFKLVIEYDGSAYHGWQRQKNDRTIQGEMEKAIQTMICRPIVLIGSGRTDAGVHALGQVANFICSTSLTAEVLLRGLNRLLPGDIVVHSCRQVETGFHARYSAKSKTYRYHILNQYPPRAVGRQYAWQIRQPLNLEAMQLATQCLLGEQDFKAFEGSGSPRATTVRNILKADLHKEKNCLIFDIQANGFLRYMVRNIVGSLVEVGFGKMSPAGFKAILDGRDRQEAGLTAPPHGLFLMGVDYGLGSEPAHGVFPGEVGEAQRKWKEQ